MFRFEHDQVRHPLRRPETHAILQGSTRRPGRILLRIDEHQPAIHYTARIPTQAIQHCGQVPYRVTLHISGREGLPEGHPSIRIPGNSS